MNIVQQTTKMFSLRSLVNPIKVSNALPRKLPLAGVRNLWTLEPRAGASLAAVQHKKLLKLQNETKLTATCFSHTKAEQELVEFLTEEILEERKAHKAKNIPTEIDGFKVSLNGAEVTLEKKVDGETIKLHFNVNHTVDADQDEENTQLNKGEVVELKSKPTFDVNLTRGDTTVTLQCSFISNEDAQEDGYNDIFGIDEICIYNGEWKENVYAVAGEVVDTYLYDLLMNYLDEKGVTNDFVEKMGNLSTAYEHAAYIGLLEGLSKFVTKK